MSDNNSTNVKLSASAIENRQDKQPEKGPSAEFSQQGETITAEEATNTAGVGIFQVKLIILSGFVWMARGFEMVVIESVSPLISCIWDLKIWHGALLSTLSLFCTILGCLLHGIWSDHYGRRTALSSSLIFLFVFGAVSAGLPNFTWFVIFRSVAAFAVGGLPQTLVLCCEFLPYNKRGRAVFILSFFWALGVVIMIIVLYSSQDAEGSWRVFIAVGALPAFVAMILMRFFPESFRFLMVTNQYFEANEIMVEMAEANKKNITAQLEPLPPAKPRRFVIDLLVRPFLMPTLLFWFMGFATAISSMGLSDFTPIMIERKSNRFGYAEIRSLHFLTDIYQPIHCLTGPTEEMFVFSVWTTALDFPGFLIYLLLVDVIGRKTLLCLSYLVSTIFIFLLFVPSDYHSIYIAFIYCARTMLNGQFDLLLLMVAEAFPTSHRGTAVGMEVAIFTVGFFIGPYILQSLLWKNSMYPIILYGVIIFLCTGASLGLNARRELTDVIKR